ncbi:MAG TPA: hypothetical protein VGA65_07275 [Hyphomicrobium sp.]|jgi:hypothetical protein
MRNPALAPLLLAALALPLAAERALSQEWNPFDSFGGSQRKRAEQRAPAQGRGTPDTAAPQFLDRGSFAVERGELAPVMADDGSGLPFELWRGLNVRALEGLIAELEIPPRAPALHALWRRLITSNVTPPTGGEADQQFMALRLETLYRSGLLDEVSRELARMPAGNALVATLAARNEIGLGKKDQACTTARSGGAPIGSFPKHLLGQTALVSGYCAAIAQDAAGAGLAADLAREEGLKNSAGLQALYAFSVGSKPAMAVDQEISLLDFRILEATGAPPDTADILKHASPSLLAALALDPSTQADLKLTAAEAAAQLNAITPDELAAIYRAQAMPSAQAAASSAPALRRAQLFVAAETERTPLKQVRRIRSFLDESRRSGLYMTALHMMAPACERVPLAPEIGWFAETGVEIALTAGDYERARSWATFGTAVNGNGTGGLDHWLALIDIADDHAGGDRESSLRYVETLAVHGRLDATLLHRLATVLDALEYNVPIPLWEAASRTPQPTGGFLPETGVLSELQDAAKKREFGRTVLLTMKTLGPNGAEGAHMIALGDSMRALRKAGLEADARRLGFEALFASWPRAIVN